VGVKVIHTCWSVVRRSAGESRLRSTAQFVLVNGFVPCPSRKPQLQASRAQERALGCSSRSDESAIGVCQGRIKSLGLVLVAHYVDGGSAGDMAILSCRQGRQVPDVVHCVLMTPFKSRSRNLPVRSVTVPGRGQTLGK